MSGLSREVNRNLYQFYRHIGELCGYAYGQIGVLDYVWNQKGTWPAYILGVPDRAMLSGIVTAIEQKEIPPFWIIEETPVFDLTWLEERNVRPIREWKGMTLNPADFVNVPRVPGVEVRSNDPETLQDWLQIVNTDLMTGTQIGTEVISGLNSSPAFRWSVAYLDDQPVGTGLSFTQEGVTGLYMIVTKESFRGKGIGSLITVDLINHAIKAGIHSVVLHATGLGEGIYRKIGFREENMLYVMWYLGG